MFSVVLDTCVLWPSLHRDFLLSLSIEGLYRPLWSATILEELEYSEERKLLKRGTPPVDATAQSSTLVNIMRTTFTDALITGWEGLEGSYDLPDPNDEHVVAAAVVGGAGAIVTYNLKDFPVDRIPPTVQILHPTTFVTETVVLNPNGARRAIQAIAGRSGRHGQLWSPDDVMHRLETRYGLGEAMAIIREAG